jgi:hypothetical protein
LPRWRKGFCTNGGPRQRPAPAELASAERGSLHYTAGRGECSAPAELASGERGSLH